MIRNVGVIGTGVIGKPIALRLVQAGFQVAVHDVRPEPIEALRAAGAVACGSAAEVAGRSDLVVSLVLDGAQTRDVVWGSEGVLRAIRPGTTFATGSTLGPTLVQSIAAALAQNGCSTLDMPITGGYLAAYEGKLALMIGGDAADLDRARPAFAAFANVIVHAGGIGAGQSAKLAHQLVMGMNILGLLEGLAFAKAAGVDPAVMRAILKQGLANSTVLDVWPDLGPRWKAMLVPSEPGAPLPNLRKDLHTVIEHARALGIDLPLGEAACRVADSGRAIGHDDPAL